MLEISLIGLKMKKDELESDTTTSAELMDPELISRPELTSNSSIDENVISLQ